MAVTALLGSHEHNHDFDAFAEAIEGGELPLMVDVPKARMEEIRTAIQGHLPQAAIGVALSKA